MVPLLFITSFKAIIFVFDVLILCSLPKNLNIHILEACTVKKNMGLIPIRAEKHRTSPLELGSSFRRQISFLEGKFPLGSQFQKGFRKNTYYIVFPDFHFGIKKIFLFLAYLTQKRRISSRIGMLCPNSIGDQSQIERRWFPQRICHF